MREIKFRAWDKDRNSMSPVNTLTGWLTDSYAQFPQEHGYGFFEKLIWMQYTGLLDKNGKEIYEGDILTTLSGTVDQVVFENDGWKFYGTSISSWRIPEGLEIIGNIYQNKELLS